MDGLQYLRIALKMHTQPLDFGDSNYSDNVGVTHTSWIYDPILVMGPGEHDSRGRLLDVRIKSHISSWKEKKSYL